jgi:hypothetical protein
MVKFRGISIGVGINKVQIILPFCVDDVQK